MRAGLIYPTSSCSEPDFFLNNDYIISYSQAQICLKKTFLNYEAAAPDMRSALFSIKLNI